MNAVILYDSRSSGGSTDAMIEVMGQRLGESGFYVEKAKCKIAADYSFIKDFDLVILGAPVYNFVVASKLLGALIQSNLKKCLKGKKIALFLTCGSPEPVAELLYMPQLKLQLISNKILAERVLSSASLGNGAVETFVEDILEEYNKKPKSKTLSAKWSDEAMEWYQSMPSFIQVKFKTVAEQYAEDMGYDEITVDVLMEARSALEN